MDRNGRSIKPSLGLSLDLTWKRPPQSHQDVDKPRNIVMQLLELPACEPRVGGKWSFCFLNGSTFLQPKTVSEAWELKTSIAQGDGLHSNLIAAHIVYFDNWNSSTTLKIKWQNTLTQVLQQIASCGVDGNVPDPGSWFPVRLKPLLAESFVSTWIFHAKVWGVALGNSDASPLSVRGHVCVSCCRQSIWLGDSFNKTTLRWRNHLYPDLSWHFTKSTARSNRRLVLEEASFSYIESVFV